MPNALELEAVGRLELTDSEVAIRTGTLHANWPPHMISLTRPGNEESLHYALRWSPDGKALAVASRETALRIWHIPDHLVRSEQAEKRKNRLLCVVEDPNLDPINDVAWSPDGQTVAIASNSIWFYDVENKAVVDSLSPCGDSPYTSLSWILRTMPSGRQQEWKSVSNWCGN